MPWEKTYESKRRDARTYDHRWRKTRKAYLARHPACEIRMPGCTGKATEVDHIVQAANDPGHRHLRAACTYCHRKVTAQQGMGARGRRGSGLADPAPRPSVW